MRLRIFSRNIFNTLLKNAKLFLLLIYFITAIWNCLYKLKSAKKTTKIIPNRTNSKPVAFAFIKTPALKKGSIWKRLKLKPVPASTPNLLNPFLLARRNVKTLAIKAFFGKRFIIFGEKLNGSTSFFNCSKVRLRKNTLATWLNKG
ncbi:hypothetical protein GGTG_11556 [Gaeumannomyces tritici R3-111a-1]|uniref:Uncharacterized protein n=1 Tax=Gaeumannomyces tritici (strain R3-111a-1) TaxID=644352 RepID=J3PDI3_GAET3|nr:hypothetical protein GGTG_11556 [Gaeumannomyces tritici R3-111a-1]EJT70533.1 hypothetical protein GGTG_11556 [Gaeumannomyces tritici R3-111a-1]